MVVPRVLVSEDESDIREIVRYKLETAGYDVTAVADGATALACALTDTPDLVLLDVMTPGLSGLDVCTALRGNPATARVPIMMLTAETDASDISAGYEAGADAYMLKPFSPRALLTQVRTMLHDAA